jgi:hypothetical protein
MASPETGKVLSQGVNRHTLETQFAPLETRAARAAENGVSKRTQEKADYIARERPDLKAKIEEIYAAAQTGKGGGNHRDRPPALPQSAGAKAKDERSSAAKAGKAVGVSRACRSEHGRYRVWRSSPPQPPLFDDSLELDRAD